jgi:rhodanese-related sulfurtransferase
MKRSFRVVWVSGVLAIAFASVGIVKNLVSTVPLLWLYCPPEEIVIEGVRVPLIDEREAMRFLHEPETVFVDARNCSDVAKSKVIGALCLPPDDIERRFPLVEQLIQPDSRVILYCYGPECDMAERVARFLASMGYRNMMIMSSGFAAWQRAKYPLESSENVYINDGWFAMDHEGSVYLPKPSILSMSICMKELTGLVSIGCNECGTEVRI